MLGEEERVTPIAVLCTCTLQWKLHKPCRYQPFLALLQTGICYSYSTVARDLWSITTPSTRAQPVGEGVAIDHKSHGYRAVSIIYPT